MKGRFISYLRVSTDKQGAKGLGIDAQRKAITDYLNGGQWELVKEFVEVESGKAHENRPMLKAALEACKRTGSKLLIAKLDRLSRNLAFIANLMESGVEFTAVDFPTANKLTIHILAAMAEYERGMISDRTTVALRVAKENAEKDGKKFKIGNPNGLTKEAIKRGIAASLAKRRAKADEHAKRVYSVVKQHQSEGLSLRAVARKLTEERELTPRGAQTWTAAAVRSAVMRVEGK